MQIIINNIMKGSKRNLAAITKKQYIILVFFLLLIFSLTLNLATENNILHVHLINSVFADGNTVQESSQTAEAPMLNKTNKNNKVAPSPVVALSDSAPSNNQAPQDKKIAIAVSPNTRQSVGSQSLNSNSNNRNNNNNNNSANNSSYNNSKIGKQAENETVGGTIVKGRSMEGPAQAAMAESSKGDISPKVEHLKDKSEDGNKGAKTDLKTNDGKTVGAEEVGETPEEEELFHPSKPLKVNWSFSGVFGKFDKQSIQRGLKVYQQVCAACHSLNSIAFRNLTEIGFTETQAKAIASAYQIKDGPNDVGEDFERPGALSDYFPAPYPNKQAAEASNNGSAPPDLSLMVRAREYGANYVYSLLTGFTGKESPEGLHYNPYFITGKLAMAPPLSEDIITYDDGTAASINQLAFDIVNFLHWTAEPEMEIRKSLGLKVIGFLIFLLILSCITKKRVWQHLYKDPKDLQDSKKPGKT